MAGIYIHIPFCKTRCIYCDFYSTTRSELKQQYIRALCTELKTRKGYLKEEPIETIYFWRRNSLTARSRRFRADIPDYQRGVWNRTCRRNYPRGQSRRPDGRICVHAAHPPLQPHKHGDTDIRRPHPETVEPPAQCRASHRSHTPPPPSRLPEYQHRPHLWTTG